MAEVMPESSSISEGAVRLFRRIIQEFFGKPESGIRQMDPKGNAT
jgi:hypothetical protein